MDNGQPVNNQSQGPTFFTAGVGDVPEKTNPDIKGSLNTEVYSSDHDSQRVGNVAISSSETEATTPSVERISIITSPYEGLKSNSPEEIVNLAMPPGMEEEILKNVDAEPSPKFNKSAIKTDEQLSKSGIKEVDDILMKFRQDSNPADFYDAIRDMMETNLENSYNRKLAA